MLDAGAVVRASAERRAIGESYRRLVSADAPAHSGPGLTGEQVQQLAKIAVLEQQRAQLAPRPALVLPAGYGTLPPAEQARAHLAALRVAKEQQDAAISALEDDDGQVVDAELVDE